MVEVVKAILNNSRLLLSGTIMSQGVFEPSSKRSCDFRGHFYWTVILQLAKEPEPL